MHHNAHIFGLKIEALPMKLCKERIGLDCFLTREREQSIALFAKFKIENIKYIKVKKERKKK